MFIIIDQDGNRIKIVGEFQVYGYGPDLLSIATQLQRQVELNKIDYGWITILEGYMPSSPTPKESPPKTPAPEKLNLEWSKNV